jgi:DNA (cytosine-5)-methyltransferase 1
MSRGYNVSLSEEAIEDITKLDGSIKKLVVKQLRALQDNPLWKLLIDKGIKRTELKQLAAVSTNVIAKLGKNEPVAMETLAKICTALQCGLDDIVEITSDAKGGSE